MLLSAPPCLVVEVSFYCSPKATSRKAKRQASRKPQGLSEACALRDSVATGNGHLQFSASPPTALQYMSFQTILRYLGNHRSRNQTFPDC